MRRLIAQQTATNITLRYVETGSPTPEVCWLKNSKIPQRDFEKKVV